MSNTMERKKGLLFIKPDTLEHGQLMKYEVLHYLKKKGCDFLKMRYLVLTKEFLELHYQDIKEHRPQIFEEMLDQFEGQMVTALEVELPMTYDKQGNEIPMSCEEFRETIIGPTFVSFDAIYEKESKKALEEKVEKGLPKVLTEEEKNKVYLTAQNKYTDIQRTMRGMMTNLLEYVSPSQTKSFNTVHYSASAEEAKDELYRVFEQEFEGKVASRIIEADEISEMLSVIDPITQTPNRILYEHFRYKFDQFKKDMIQTVGDLPDDILVERFVRYCNDKRFANPQFLGDKTFQQFVSDMENLSKSLLSYESNKNHKLIND